MPDQQQFQRSLCISKKKKANGSSNWCCRHNRDRWTKQRLSDSRVAGLLQLCPCLKYWGFSTTGMRVMPMTTASGPASRVQGVIIPWLTWWRGLAESSSPLMTATGPGTRQKDDQSTSPASAPSSTYAAYLVQEIWLNGLFFFSG